VFLEACSHVAIRDAILIDGVSTASVCSGMAGSLAISGENPGYSFRGNNRLTPTIELKSGSVVLPTSASFPDDHTILVSIPADVAPGDYDLVITRAVDQRQKILPAAVRVLDAPVVTEVVGLGVCLEGTRP